MLKDFQGNDKVCKLQRAIYGLRQSGRQWHSELDKTLRNMDFLPTNADPCVYVNEDKSVFILVYVDDILLISRDRKKMTPVKRGLSQAFSIKDLGLAKYCLGMEPI